MRDERLVVRPECAVARPAAIVHGDPCHTVDPAALAPARRSASRIGAPEPMDTPPPLDSRAAATLDVVRRFKEAFNRHDVARSWRS